MSVTVVTTSPGFGKAGNLPDRIRATGWTFVRCSGDDIDRYLPEADFLVAGLPRVDGETLHKAARLKAVLKHGVGLDSIDVGACTAHGIPVLNTPGANATAVAELALAGIFAMSRNVVGGHLSVTSGGWDRRAGREVEGATLGVIGFGAIGRTLAAKARALGMRVLATDLNPDRSYAEKIGVELVSIDEILASSDFVSLHVFGGAGNTALISTRELSAIKPGAVVLNLARGEVVDLDALHLSLKSGHIGGAVIDAYVTEPPDISHPIFQDQRVLFSPHSGADTDGSLIRMGGMVLDDIEALLRGEMPDRAVNRRELQPGL
jgi:D-3-phosphoglycerate dehydrogenase